MANRRRIVMLAAMAAAMVTAGVATVVADPLDTWDLLHDEDCVGDRFNPIRPDGTRDPLGDPVPGTPEWDEQQAERLVCDNQRDEDRRYHPSSVIGYNAATYGQDWYREPVRFDGVRFRYTYLPAEDLAALGLGIPGVAAAEIYRPCDGASCASLPAELEAHEPPYPVALIWHGATAQMKHHRFTAQALAEAGYLAVVINGAPVGGAPTFPDGAMGPAVLDWLASPESGEFGEQADLSRVGFMGHSAGAAAAVSNQGDPRVDAFVAWDSNSAGDAITEDNCVDGNPCAPIMYLRADGAFSAPQARARSTYANRDWGYVPYLTHKERGMDVMHITFRNFNHIDYNGNGVGGLAGNRYAELVINYYTLAWMDRHVKGALVTDADGAVVSTHERSEAEERAYRQGVVATAYQRLVAEKFDDSADRHNTSMGFYDPVQHATSLDPLYGGNVPYRIEGFWTTDRLATDFRNYCAVSLPNYVDPDAGPVLARADSGGAHDPVDPETEEVLEFLPADDMRIHGCPEVAP